MFCTPLHSLLSMLHSFFRFQCIIDGCQEKNATRSVPVDVPALFGTLRDNKNVICNKHFSEAGRKRKLLPYATCAIKGCKASGTTAKWEICPEFVHFLQKKAYSNLYICRSHLDFEKAQCAAEQSQESSSSASSTGTSSEDQATSTEDTSDDDCTSAIVVSECVVSVRSMLALLPYSLTCSVCQSRGVSIKAQSMVGNVLHVLFSCSHAECNFTGKWTSTSGLIPGTKILSSNYRAVLGAFTCEF